MWEVEACVVALGRFEFRLAGLRGGLREKFLGFGKGRSWTWFEKDTKFVEGFLTRGVRGTMQRFEIFLSVEGGFLGETRCNQASDETVDFYKYKLFTEILTFKLFFSVFLGPL